MGLLRDFVAVALPHRQRLCLWKPPGNDSLDLGWGSPPRRGRKIIDKRAETWYNFDYEKVYLYFI